MPEKDILDNLGEVADDAAEIAGSGAVGGKAQVAAAAYEVAKKTGLLDSLTNLLRGIVGLFRKR